MAKIILSDQTLCYIELRILILLRSTVTCNGTCIQFTYNSNKSIVSGRVLFI